MSIRYTLRHNIPSALVDAENAKYEQVQEGVSDSSIFDFNLLRKHELAETDDGRVVYRQRSGQIVDWTEQALTEAIGVKDECLGIKGQIEEYIDGIQSDINSSIATAQEQQGQVGDLIDEVEDMIDLEKITDEEIDTVVEGGE